jgi:hypothetical protein
MVLDTDEPVIIWRPETQKNSKRAELAMAPELAEVLRQWRAVADDGELVFPHALGKHTFNNDRDRAGVARYDNRQRGLTAHGFRKWAPTMLHNAGVPEPMVRKLTRHAGDVHDRYYDDAANQAEALNKLPQIYPPQGVGGREFTGSTPESAPQSAGNGVDSGGQFPTISPVTSMNTHTAQPANSRPELRIGVTSNRPVGAGLHALCGDNGAQPGEDGHLNGDWGAHNPQGTQHLSPPSWGPRGGGPPHSPGRSAEGHHRNDALADLLDAAARLVRGGEG